MNILPTKKGYKIQNIYYSDDKNNIVKISLKKIRERRKTLYQI